VNRMRSFAFLTLLLCCALYSYWQTTKDYVWIVPYMEERLPAAVRESQDYKQLVDRPLRAFKRDVVADSISLKPDGKHFLVTFGHFSVAGSKGPNFLCFEYPFIKLQLRGVGMAIAGKQTRLEVVAPCRHQTETPELITDIEVPFADIYRRPAQDASWTHQQDQFESQISTKDVVGEWPQQWQLESIQFLKDTNDHFVDTDLTITSDEIFKKRGGPLLIQLTQ